MYVCDFMCSALEAFPCVQSGVCVDRCRRIYTKMYTLWMMAQISLRFYLSRVSRELSQGVGSNMWTVNILACWQITTIWVPLQELRKRRKGTTQRQKKKTKKQKRTNQIHNQLWWRSRDSNQNTVEQSGNRLQAWSCALPRGLAHAFFLNI